MMIAQHHTEADRRPIITHFTTKLALQNMAKTEPSVPAAATVHSFIAAILANPAAALFRRREEHLPGKSVNCAA